MNLNKISTTTLIKKAQRGRAWLIAHQSPQNSSEAFRIATSHHFKYNPGQWEKALRKYEEIIDELKFRGMTEEDVHNSFPSRVVEDLTLEEGITTLL